MNLLTELKRTKKKEFQLDFLRPNQIKGLVDFDQVIERNYGIVLVSFLDLPKVDEAYAIRLTTALRYMQITGRRSIPLEDLRNGKTVAGKPIAMNLLSLNQSERAYDLRGLTECYKFL
jgi:penicillin-binding protein-related factor A (putative recombinase)